MGFNPSTFIISKVENDPQGFIDEIEKILRVMHATNSKGVNFVSY